MDDPGAVNGNSVTSPVAETRASDELPVSVSQMLPSGPPTIPSGKALLDGSVISVSCPAVVMCPILLPLYSVNHRSPLDPSAIPRGSLAGVGVGYSV